MSENNSSETVAASTKPVITKTTPKVDRSLNALDRAVMAFSNRTPKYVDIYAEADKKPEATKDEEVIATEEVSKNVESSEGQDTTESLEQTTETPAIQKDNAVVEESAAEETQSIDSAQETTEAQETAAEIEEPATKAPKKLLKQLDKRTAEVHALTEQNQQLQQRMDELEKRLQNSSENTKPQDFGNFTDRVDLDKLREEYGAVLNARKVLERALWGKDKVDDSGQEYLLEIDGKRFTREQVIAQKEIFDKQADEQLPNRIKLLESARSAKSQFDDTGKQWFGWYTDKNNEKRRLVDQIKSNPQYAKLFYEIPDAELMLSAYVEMAELKKSAGVVESKPKIDPKTVIKKSVAMPKPVGAKSSSGQAPSGNDFNATNVQNEFERLKLAARNARASDKQEALQKLMSFKSMHGIGRVS